MHFQLVIGKKIILQSTMLLPITLHTEIQVFGLIIQTVGMDLLGLTKIHNNYQKDIGSFVEVGLGKAFHHTSKVIHAALEGSQ